MLPGCHISLPALALQNASLNFGIDVTSGILLRKSPKDSITLCSGIELDTSCEWWASLDVPTSTISPTSTTFNHNTTQTTFCNRTTTLYHTPVLCCIIIKRGQSIIAQDFKSRFASKLVYSLTLLSWPLLWTQKLRNFASLEQSLSKPLTFHASPPLHLQTRFMFIPSLPSRLIRSTLSLSSAWDHHRILFHFTKLGHTTKGLRS